MTWNRRSWFPQTRSLFVIDPPETDWRFVYIVYSDLFNSRVYTKKIQHSHFCWSLLLPQNLNKQTNLFVNNVNTWSQIFDCVSPHILHSTCGLNNKARLAGYPAMCGLNSHNMRYNVVGSLRTWGRPGWRKEFRSIPINSRTTGVLLDTSMEKSTISNKLEVLVITSSH